MTDCVRSGDDGRYFGPQRLQPGGNNSVVKELTLLLEKNAFICLGLVHYPLGYLRFEVVGGNTHCGGNQDIVQVDGRVGMAGEEEVYQGLTSLVGVCEAKWHK